MLIPLGDYVDRGIDSKGVIEQLIALGHLRETRQRQLCFTPKMSVLCWLPSTTTEDRSAPGGSRQNLGACYYQMGDWVRAETEFRAAVEIQQALIAHFPQLRGLRSGLAATPDFLVELGGNLCNIGNSLRRDQRPADALEFYGQAIETLEAVLAKEPQLPLAQKFLANAYAARALALSKLDRAADSLHDADRALQLVEPADRAFFVLMRARCLAGQSTELATAEVEQLLQQDGDGSTRYLRRAFRVRADLVVEFVSHVQLSQQATQRVPIGLLHGLTAS